MGRYWTLNYFPVAWASNCIQRCKTHNMFLKKYKTLTEIYKPTKFTGDTNWQDWLLVFKIFAYDPGKKQVDFGLYNSV